MAKRGIAFALCAISVMCLVLSAALGATLGISASPAFFTYEGAKYGLYDTIGCDKATYQEIATVVTDFLMLRQDNIDMHARIGGEIREVFSDKEKAHMDDVQGLYRLAIWGLVILLGVGILTMAAFCLIIKKGQRKVLFARAGLCALCVLILGIGALVAYAVVDFQGLFVRFHELSFSNDLWQLDPYNDVILMMMPLNFFMDCAAIIAGATIGVMLLIAGMSIRFLIADRRKRASVHLEAIAASDGAFYRVNNASTGERPDAQEIFANMGLEDEQESAAPPPTPEEFFWQEPIVPSEETPVQVEPINTVINARSNDAMPVRVQMDIQMQLQKDDLGQVQLHIVPGTQPNITISALPKEWLLGVENAPKLASGEEEPITLSPKERQAREATAYDDAHLRSAEEILRQMDEMLKTIAPEREDADADTGA